MIGSGARFTSRIENIDPVAMVATSNAAAAPAPSPIRRICVIAVPLLLERLETDRGPPQPEVRGRMTEDGGRQTTNLAVIPGAAKRRSGIHERKPRQQ